MGEGEELLRFLLPGLTHGLGNALFAIQGHAQVLGMNGGDVARERGAILKGAEKARGALDVLGWLQEDAASSPVQAGIGLQRLCEFLRVPLRERGLRSGFRHSSVEPPAMVDGRTLCRAVVGVVCRLIEVVPAGYDGRLEVDVVVQREPHVVVALRVVHGPAQLPFPIDLAQARRQSSPALAVLGIAVEDRPGQQELWLRLPLLRPAPVSTPAAAAGHRAGYGR